ncbi:unnamed protein product, partial [Mesorhabditis spiculigera]
MAGEFRTNLGSFCRNFGTITKPVADDWLSVNFANYKDIVETLEEEYTNGSLMHEIEALLEDLQGIDMKEFTREFWKEMKDGEGLEPLVISAILWILIETAAEKHSKEDAFRTGCAAASLYMRLSSIDGAAVRNFMHGAITQQVLAVWRDAFRVVIFGVRDLATMVVAVDVKGGRGKGRKRKKDLDLTDAIDRPESYIQNSVAVKVLEESTCVLLLFLGKVDLNNSSTIAEAIADYVRDLARIDYDETAKEDFRVKPVETTRDMARTARMVNRSFALAHALCDPRHSDDYSLVYERIVQPRLLATDPDNNPYNISIPTAAITLSQATLNFVKLRMEDADEKEQNIFYELLIALIMRADPRAHYREFLPGTILLELVKLLPDEKVFALRKMLLILSRRPKINVTAMAVCYEMIRSKFFDWSKPDPDYEKYVAEQAERNERKNATMFDRSDAENESRDEAEVSEDEGEVARKKKAKRKSMQADALNKDASFREEDGAKKQKRVKKKKAHKNPYFPRGDAILYRILVEALIYQTANVRSRALLLIGQLMQTAEFLPGLRDAAHDVIFVLSMDEQTLYDEGSKPSQNMFAEDSLFKLLLNGARDEYADVRQKCLGCLERYLPHVADLHAFSLGLHFMQRLCLDGQASVRKTASTSMTTLLSALEEGSVQWHKVANSWVSSVFPMIGDADAKMAERVASLILELVFEPLLEATDNEVGGLAAEVLKRIAPGSSNRADLIRALHRNVVHNLQKRLAKVQNENLWTLYDCLVRVFPNAIDPNFITQKWFEYTKAPRPLNEWTPMTTIPSGTTAHVLLNVMRIGQQKFDEKQRQRLVDNFQEHIRAYTVPTQVIGALWLTMASLCDHQPNGVTDKPSQRILDFSSETYRFALGVFGYIWKMPMDEFHKTMPYLKHADIDYVEIFLKRMITNTGLAVQYNFKLIYLIDQDTIGDIREEPLLLSYLLKITTSCLSDMRFGLLTDRKKIKLHNGPHPFGFPPKGKDGQWTVCAEWQKQRFAYSDVILGFSVESTFSDRIRAAAALALGSHCILDSELARVVIPELKTTLLNDVDAIRANLLVPCCDIMKRFPVAETHDLPGTIAVLLVDPHPMIRLQCLEMVTHLLKEQYLKWEGPIMHLYLALCIDKNLETSSYAQDALINALLPLDKDMLYANYMEYLLFYNNAPFKWNDKEGLVSARRRQVRVDGIGAEMQRYNWRQTLLRFVLSTFTDVQRFGTMVRICEDILLRVANKALDIKDDCIDRLTMDCLELFISEEMSFTYSIGKKPAAAAEDEAEEAPEAPENVMSAAKEGVVEAYRRGLTDKILPILFQLLTTCERERAGRHTRKITLTIAMLCKDHLEHLEDMLRALHPNRARHILHAIRDDDGFVKREMALRKHDKERDNAEELRVLLEEIQRPSDGLLKSAKKPKTPKIRPRSRMAQNETTYAYDGQAETIGADGLALLRRASEAPSENGPPIPLAIPLSDDDDSAMDADAAATASTANENPAPVDADTAEPMEVETSPPAVKVEPAEATTSSSPAARAAESTQESSAPASTRRSTARRSESRSAEKQMDTAESTDDVPTASTVETMVKEEEAEEMEEDEQAQPEAEQEDVEEEPPAPAVAVKEEVVEEEQPAEVEAEEPMDTESTVATTPARTSTRRRSAKRVSEVENTPPSTAVKSVSSSAFENDETMCPGGRHFSTPNKDPANLELTFPGLDFSVIPKDSEVTRKPLRNNYESLPEASP